MQYVADTALANHGADDGSEATLLSPVLVVRHSAHCVLEFAYSLQGKHMGALSVEAKDVDADEAAWVACGRARRHGARFARTLPPMSRLLAAP